VPKKESKKERKKEREKARRKKENDETKVQEILPFISIYEVYEVCSKSIRTDHST